MDELLIEKNESVIAFLERLISTKTTNNKDVIGKINGIIISTEGFTSSEQLKNTLASELDKLFSKNNRIVNPSTQDLAQVDYVFDSDTAEDLQVDWNDPSDVLRWMQESQETLNNPKYANIIYTQDGKTPAEFMLQLLENHDYGIFSANMTNEEKQIMTKMTDLKNSGFFKSDFFESTQTAAQTVEKTDIVQEAQKVEESSQEEKAKSFTVYNQSNEKDQETEKNVNFNVYNKNKTAGGNDMNNTANQGNNSTVIPENISETDLTKALAQIAKAIATRDTVDFEVANEQVRKLQEHIDHYYKVYNEEKKMSQSTQTNTEHLPSKEQKKDEAKDTVEKILNIYGTNLTKDEIMEIRKLNIELAKSKANYKNISEHLNNMKKTLSLYPNTTQPQLNQKLILETFEKENRPVLSSSFITEAQEKNLGQFATEADTEAIQEFWKISKKESTKEELQAALEKFQSLPNISMYKAGLLAEAEKLVNFYNQKEEYEKLTAPVVEPVEPTKPVLSSSFITEAQEKNPGQFATAADNEAIQEFWKIAKKESTKEELQAALEKFQALPNISIYKAGLLAEAEKLVNFYNQKEAYERMQEKSVIDDFIKKSQGIPSMEEIIELQNKVDDLPHNNIYKNSISNELKKFIDYHESEQLKQQILNEEQSANEIAKRINEINDRLKELQKKGKNLDSKSNVVENKENSEQNKEQSQEQENHEVNNDPSKEEEKEPPLEVINETVNDKPGLFKRASQFAKKALKAIWANPIGKVVLVGLGVAAPVLGVAALAIGLSENGNTKQELPVETTSQMEQSTDEDANDLDEDTPTVDQNETEDKEAEMTPDEILATVQAQQQENAIDGGDIYASVHDMANQTNAKHAISEGAQEAWKNAQPTKTFEVIEMTNENGQKVWDTKLIETDEQLATAISNGSNIGFEWTNEGQVIGRTISSSDLENYMTTHGNQLPSVNDVEEIKQNEELEKNNAGQSIDSISEGIGKGK